MSTYKHSLYKENIYITWINLAKNYNDSLKKKIHLMFLGNIVGEKYVFDHTGSHIIARYARKTASP